MMKLLRVGESGQERPALVHVDGSIRDLSDLIHDISSATLNRSVLRKLASYNHDALPDVTGSVSRVGPCVAGTRNFIAVGLNYVDHAAESGAAVPKEPVLFNKAPSCIVGPNDDVELPRDFEKTDWEVELAVVIGERASYINESDVPQVVAGYCVCNDVSERSFQLQREGQWMKGKGCPTFGPLGPWLVTHDEIQNVQSLSMWLDVNGRRMQTGKLRP
jgi:2-keto-4-pentenoate hydratase/2-oxohepta-3-ene-1,7-dioic acid hydratase in catechol pathway